MHPWMKAAAAIALLACACHRTPVPVRTQLLRVDAPWMTPAPGDNRRTAPGTIIVFRDKGEFIELHCWLIEQPDETLYIASREPRVAAIGTWKKRGAHVDVMRTRVARTRPLTAPVEPLCAEGKITLQISGSSVVGNVGGTGSDTYAPVSRLVAPDFESYIDAARRSPVTCVVEKE